MARLIAVHTITQQDALDVLAVLLLPAGKHIVIHEVPDFRRNLIEAALVGEDDQLERLERGFEGLVSAVRLRREGGGAGTTLLQELAVPGPF